MVVPDECFRDLIYFSSPQNWIGTTNYQFERGRDEKCLVTGGRDRNQAPWFRLSAAPLPPLSDGGGRDRSRTPWFRLLPAQLPPLSVGGASMQCHARFSEAPLQSRTVGFPESGFDLGSREYAFPSKLRFKCWHVYPPVSPVVCILLSLLPRIPEQALCPTAPSGPQVPRGPSL